MFHVRWDDCNERVGNTINDINIIQSSCWQRPITLFRMPTVEIIPVIHNSNIWVRWKSEQTILLFEHWISFGFWTRASNEMSEILEKFWLHRITSSIFFLLNCALDCHRQLFVCRFFSNIWLKGLKAQSRHSSVIWIRYGSQLGKGNVYFRSEFWAQAFKSPYFIGVSGA